MLFHKETKEPSVNIITTWTDTNEAFYAPGALVEVKNGKGLLREVHGKDNSASYVTLMFGEQPLIQFQGDEYYCPTCEKMLKSGYSLEQSKEFRMDAVNQGKEHVSFAEVLEEMKPLLGLMYSNHYIILDTKLYPTDGNGHLFWSVPNEDKSLPGTCLYQFRDGSYDWGNLHPYFTVASQSVGKLNEKQVEFYRQQKGTRAIAYYMDGYMTCLLDGHHKTMAAALEHEMVNAIVIMPCYLKKQVQEDGSYKDYIGCDDICFSCEEYGIQRDSSFMGEQISNHGMKQILKKITSHSFSPWEQSLPYDNDDLVSYYPSVDEVAYIDLVGEIKEEYLDQICKGEIQCSELEVCRLLRAMRGMKHKRLREVADALLHRLYDKNSVYECVEALITLPHSEEFDQYMLDVMVEFEDDYPWVKELILNWL